MLEDGNLELRDKQDNRVQDPDKMTETLSIEKAAQLLAKKEGLWSDENGKGKPAPKPTATPPEPTRRPTAVAKGAGLGNKPSWA